MTSQAATKTGKKQIAMWVGGLGKAHFGVKMADAPGLPTYRTCETIEECKQQAEAAASKIGLTLNWVETNDLCGRGISGYVADFSL